MADLEEITETPRTNIDSDLNNEEKNLTIQNSKKRKRSKKRRNSCGSQSTAQPSSSDQVFEEVLKEDESVEQNLRQQTDSPRWDAMPTQEDHQTHFYENYRKVAEEYDKEFLKKYDEDLNTTLIFAGLFSAVTSAFIIQFVSQLQPDPDDETAAILRILLYKIDNTTFGNEIPTLPQWTGPSHTIVQVQAILFASLATSLFSAFLAMLGKQWLSRYQSADMRGSAIERSHNRQQKLGGIIGWYFDYVMESLPLMLQVALLLLGCALSRYLWEINVTVASVVLGVTSFGAIFYVFIVIAGTSSDSCPYQTPASNILRHILHRLLPTLRSAFVAVPGVFSSNFSRLFHTSWCCQLFPAWWVAMTRPWYACRNVACTIFLIGLLPIASVHDAYLIGQTLLQFLYLPSRKVYHLLTGRHKTAYRLFIDASSLRTLVPDQKTIRLDLQCISWILQTSLDKAIRTSAFRHLTSIPHLAYFNPTLIVDCFNVFIGCIHISNGKVVIIQGLGQLATVSANAFFRTLHHVEIMDPTSTTLANIRGRYNEVFPSELDLTSLPFHSTMTDIHALAGRFGNPRDIRWNNYKMSIHEHIPFAQRMVQVAQERYQRTRHPKVPRWVLHSALYLLSFGSVSPPSVVADCLTVIAIDLSCGVLNTMIPDESVRIEHVSTLITQKLETMVESADPDLILSKRKAISALLPYAIFLEQGRQQWMVDAIFRAARASGSGKFTWHRTTLYICRLFEKRSPTSLNRVIVLVSPYVPWHGTLNNKVAVDRWAAAASAISYTEEIGQSVVDALLRVAYIDLLRPHIPIAIWRWMKRQTSLPSVYHGDPSKGDASTLHFIRRLGDIEILKSYFLLLWTDRWAPDISIILDTEISIRKDFGGAEVERHRRDLIEWLDQVLGRLDQKLEECKQNNQPSLEGDLKASKTRYMKFKDVLLEVDER